MGNAKFFQNNFIQLFEEKISKEKQNDFNTGDFSTKSGTSFMTSINSSPLQRFQIIQFKELIRSKKFNESHQLNTREGRNSRMKARDVEAMQKIKKQRPPIITDMRYVVMRRTINFEKARYQKALQNNLESDQFFLNNNLDLITSHLAEYDVSLVFLKSLQKVQIITQQ